MENPKNFIEKGFLFLESTLKGKAAKTLMIDSGATQSFIIECEAK